MSKIHSPYVVQYVESGKSNAGNVYWIVMELLRGEDINSILERDGPLSEGEVIKVIFSWSWWEPLLFLLIHTLAFSLVKNKYSHITLL